MHLKLLHSLIVLAGETPAKAVAGLLSFSIKKGIKKTLNFGYSIGLFHNLYFSFYLTFNSSPKPAWQVGQGEEKVNYERCLIKNSLIKVVIFKCKKIKILHPPPCTLDAVVICVPVIKVPLQETQ